MAEESFLLVSLKEGKSKQLAQVISNETSRLILDFLTKKEATETEIAQALNLPLSTAHYNLQQLLSSGLVTVEEFHYSEKGKEVNHYKLSNKFIIIAPTITETIKQRLKKILPAGLIAIATAGFIQAYSIFRGRIAAASAPALKATEAVAAEASVQPAITPVVQNIALWFLFGALFVVILYFILGFMKK